MTDPSEFAVTTATEGRNVVFTLIGHVDERAALQLGVLLDAAIDRYPESMILDLAELESINATGMATISGAEKRLADVGVTLSVRSPSVLVNWLLTPLAMAEEAGLLPGLSGHGRLGPEDTSSTGAFSPRLHSSLSSTDPRRVLGLPTDPDVVDGALGLVVELVQTSVAGADGVSVSLLRHGTLSTVAATDQTIMAMDAHQYATGEGPCVDASVEGHWFHARSLDTETRWPSFTPKAQALGIKAILSSPLKALEKPVGALNIYTRTAETFETKDQEVAAGLAQKASVILSDAGLGVDDPQQDLFYKEALRSRNVIALAIGVIMEREGVNEDAAFTALLRLSLSDGVSLLHRAESVVLSTRPTGPPSATDADD